MSYKVPFVDYPKQCRTLKKELMPVIEDVVFRRSDLFSV